MSKFDKYRGASDDGGTFGPRGNPYKLDDYCDHVNREFGHMCLASIMQDSAAEGAPPPPRRLNLSFNKVAREPGISKFEAWAKRIPSMSFAEINAAPDQWKRIAEVRMLLRLEDNGTYTHRKRKVQA